MHCGAGTRVEAAGVTLPDPGHLGSSSGGGPGLTLDSGSVNTCSCFLLYLVPADVPDDALPVLPLGSGAEPSRLLLAASSPFMFVLLGEERPLGQGLSSGSLPVPKAGGLAAWPWLCLCLWLEPLAGNT